MPPSQTHSRYFPTFRAGSNDSYFKFNLDYINLYNLVRLESSSTKGVYERAYSIVRNHTAGHQNAFFDAIDLALQGSNATRDAEMLALLDQWLLRPRRDPYVDVSGRVFSMNGNGTGVAAATAFRTQAPDPRVQSPVPIFQCDSSGCISAPIALGVDTPVYLTLYGTGIRGRSSLPDFAGLDQVNVALTLNLRGSGESNVVLTVDGQTTNTVTVDVK